MFNYNTGIMKTNKTGQNASDPPAQQDSSRLPAPSDQPMATEDSSTQPKDTDCKSNDTKPAGTPVSSDTLADRYNREAPEELRK
jgi:hypothetical protein